MMRLLLLLQQHYQNLNGSGNFMRAATLKALAIHSADEAGPAPGPDYAFGWGLLNTKSAAQVIVGNGGDHQIIEDVLSDGVQDTVQIDVGDPDARLSEVMKQRQSLQQSTGKLTNQPDRCLRLIRLHTNDVQQPWLALRPAEIHSADTRQSSVSDSWTDREPDYSRKPIPPLKPTLPMRPIACFSPP